MKRNEIRLLVITLMGILVFAIFSTLTAEPPVGSRNSVRSDDPNGAMALRWWLEDSGYIVKELVSSDTDPNDLDVIFLLNPRSQYNIDEAEKMQAWVQQGNTLIVAGDEFAINPVLQPYRMRLAYLSEAGDFSDLAAPTLITPPLEDVPTGRYWVYRIESQREDLVPHLMANNEPIAASFNEGAGMVWVAGTVYPFTNIGLQDEASARFLMNILADVPRGSRVGFDEGLYIFRTQTPQTLSRWITRTPAGWSILSCVFLTLMFIGWRGRRFGVAVPIKEERLRREPVEYIQAIANLLRRSGQRAAMQTHYRRQLKRALAQRYALSPHMFDEELVLTIQRRDPNVNHADLRALLAELTRKNLSERELVELISNIETWMKDNHLERFTKTH